LSFSHTVSRGTGSWYSPFIVMAIGQHSFAGRAGQNTA
jgi:hypothetical protein